MALAWSMREHLRHEAGRGVLDRVGCRLGGRPFLHRLCAAALRLHQRALRGQAGRHARCRRLLAGHRRARRRASCSPRPPRSAPSSARTPTARSSARYDLSQFRTLFLAGERADPPTVAWAEQQLEVPVIDHWWQTETGWPIAANCLGLEHAAGEARLVRPSPCRAGICACSTPSGGEAAS